MPDTWAVWGLQQYSQWLGTRYSGSLPMSSVPAFPSRAPALTYLENLPVSIASAAGPVELCSAHCSVTQT